MRSDRTALPPELLDAITANTGPIRQVVPAPAGNHAAVAATVHGAAGRTFVKASRKLSPDREGPEVRSLRNEARILPHVGALGPQLHWTVDAGAWFAIGMEHVRAGAADALAAQGGTFARRRGGVAGAVPVLDGRRPRPPRPVLACLRRAVAQPRPSSR